MNTGVVSRRYAKALLAYAKAQGQEDRVYEEVKTLALHYAEVPGLRKTVENPVLLAASKCELLCQAAGGEETSPELRRFFNLVLEEKREKFLQFMAWSYIDLYREDKHILLGTLTTAVPSERMVRHFTELLGQKGYTRVELDAKVDPALIGGYIIEIGGYRMDASVANQLKRVKLQFIARNRRIV